MSTLAITASLIGGILAITFASATIWARRHPIEAFVKMTRRSLLRARMTRRDLRLPDGKRIVYFAGGRASRTMVLVHGVNDQAGTWATVVPRLLREFRVIAVDLPGHGDSEPATGPLPMPLLVEGLRAVIDREHPEGPVILVGNSMGGWVSMLYASEFPARVEHLLLEDASGMAWDLSHVPAFPKDRDEAIRLLRMVHGPNAPIPEFLVDAILRTAGTLPQARVLQAGIAGSLVDERLQQLTMPVTLIWGEQDGLLTVAYAEVLKSRLPDATLHVVEGVAHVPHRQKPAVFAGIVTDEVNRIARAEVVQA